MSLSHSRLILNEVKDEVLGEFDSMLAQILLQTHIALSTPTSNKAYRKAIFLFEALEAALNDCFDCIGQDKLSLTSLSHLKQVFGMLRGELQASRLEVKQGAPNYHALKIKKQKLFGDLVLLCEALASCKLQMQLYSAPSVLVALTLKDCYTRAVDLCRTREMDTTSMVSAQLQEQSIALLEKYKSHCATYFEQLQKEMTLRLLACQIDADIIDAQRKFASVEAVELRSALNRHAHAVHSYDGLTRRERLKTITSALSRLEKFLKRYHRYLPRQNITNEDVDRIREYLQGCERELNSYVQEGRLLVQNTALYQRKKNQYHEQLKAAIDSLHLEIDRHTDYAAQAARIDLNKGEYLLDIKKTDLYQYIKRYKSELLRHAGIAQDLDELNTHYRKLDIETSQQTDLLIGHADVVHRISALQIAAKRFQEACYEQVAPGGHVFFFGGDLKPNYQVWRVVEDKVAQCSVIASELLEAYYQQLCQVFFGKTQDLLNIKQIIQQLNHDFLRQVASAEQHNQQYKQYLESRINQVTSVFEQAQQSLQRELEEYDLEFERQVRKTVDEFAQKLNYLATTMHAEVNVTPFADVAIPVHLITTHDVGSANAKIQAIRSRLDRVSQHQAHSMQSAFMRRFSITLASAIAGASVGIAIGSAFSVFSGGISLPVGALIGAGVGMLAGLGVSIVFQFVSYLKHIIRPISLDQILESNTDLSNAAAKEYKVKRKRTSSLIHAASVSHRTSKEDDQLFGVTESPILKKKNTSLTPQEKTQSSRRQRFFSAGERTVKNEIEWLSEFEMALAKLVLDRVAQTCSEHQGETGQSISLMRIQQPDIAKRILQDLENKFFSTIVECAQQLYSKQVFAAKNMRLFRDDYAYLSRYLSSELPIQMKP